MVQFGIVTSGYFLDRLKPYELSIICDSLHLRVKDSWEQARLISYVTAQVYSRKKIKPTDIMAFAWEGERTAAKDTHVYTDDEVRRIKEKAMADQAFLKEKGII